MLHHQLIDRLYADALGQLRPPPKLTLSKWTEEHIILPPQTSARRMRFRPWPYQREILDTIGDDETPRITIIKASRTGYTKILMATIGGASANDPCAIMLLVPTDDDARGYAVDEVEPLFEESPALRGLIRVGRIDGRNTLTMKTIAGGGSLKIMSARSPRNLRRHQVRILLVDEEDAMEVTREGDVLSLAENRTIGSPDRKIVRGSTPTDEVASSITAAYALSDQRVFEVLCPLSGCGTFFELLWEHITWPKDQPEKAFCVCPHCARSIEERYKTQMVEAGAERGWHRTRPDIVGHAGFRLNALISYFANASWGEAAKKFIEAKRLGPHMMQPFVNTWLGRVWRTSLEEIDEAKLRDRVEDFGIKPGEGGHNRFPADVFLVLAGVDTQDDRFEVLLWGFNETEAFLLSHDVVWGDPADSTTQAELDILLQTKWIHPNGWTIGIEGAAVDSQGHKSQAVYDFCTPRLPRRIYPIISRVGSRKLFEPAKRRRDGVRLFVVGHDEAKTIVLQRLAIPMVDSDGLPSPGRLRFSSDLPDETFQQITGERRAVRYIRSKPVPEFRRVVKGQPVEALDATCYAFALRYYVRVNFAERRARKGSTPLGRRTLADITSKS